MGGTGGDGRICEVCGDIGDFVGFGLVDGAGTDGPMVFPPDVAVVCCCCFALLLP